MPSSGPLPPVHLLGPNDVRFLVAELGIRPSKARGQNFLHDPNTVRRIVRLAQLTERDRVVEVGPGLGSLTLGLLEAGARVLAVEVDPRLARALSDTVDAHAPGRGGLLTVVAADAMRLDHVSEPAPTALVANLPYRVAVPLLLHLLELQPQLRTGLVMVQAEVADRLTAPPGSRRYGVPSVKVAWYAKAEWAGAVPRSVFWPVPNVDSALIRLTPHPPPTTPTGVARTDVFKVIDAAFGQRRKTLRSALTTWAGSADAAEAALRAAQLTPQARGETLSLADYVRIAAVSSGPRTGS